MAETSIGWCATRLPDGTLHPGFTFNAWEGCYKVAPECDHCYAEARDTWLHGGTHWGVDAPVKLHGDDYWRKPIGWNRLAHRLGVSLKVFGGSLMDWADNRYPDILNVQRARLFEIVKATPYLTWILLTKRIGNARVMLPKDWGTGYPNVWLCITAGTQKAFDRDYPKLAALPAHVRGVSVEPQLELLKLRAWRDRDGVALIKCPACSGTGSVPVEGGGKCCPTCFDFRESQYGGYIPAPDWVITGGESGRKPRGYDVAWPRALVQECRSAQIALFVKQLGASPYELIRDGIGAHIEDVTLDDRAGADPAEWPSDLRVQEFPT